MKAFRVRLLLAFFAIYVVWGSTYLAIRVAVQSVPPLFAAALRFLIAGALLLAWTRLRGTPWPTPREWRTLALLGVLMFLIPYATLFWAETAVPSGVAAVLVATTPLWTALLEMFVFQREPRRWTTVGAILLGLAGVATLSLDTGDGRVAVLACVAVIASDVSWSLGTALTTTLERPRSDLVSAGGQMLIGGTLLLASALLLREVPPVPAIPWPAAAAIAYQVVAGSLIAFTAYVWLLAHVPATTVTSFAYVNPVVALVIGHELGGEPITTRTIVGCVLVLASTIALLRRRPSESDPVRLPAARARS